MKRPSPRNAPGRGAWSSRGRTRHEARASRWPRRSGKQGQGTVPGLLVPAMAFVSVLMTVPLSVALSVGYMLTASAGTRSDAANALSHSVSALPEIVFPALLLMAMLVIGLTPAGGHFGLRLPVPRIRTFLAGVFWALAAMVAAGALSPLLVPEPSTNTTAVWGGQPLTDRLIRSAGAGVTEEFLFLALPVGTVTVAFMLLRQYQARVPASFGQEAAGLEARLAGLGAGVLYLIPRCEMHAYQGRHAVVGALLWTAVNLAVYSACRSVWPLISAHVLFDAVVAGSQMTVPDALALASALAVAALTVQGSMSFSSGRRPGGPGGRPERRGAMRS